MIKQKWLLFGVCILLILGSLAGMLVTRHRRNDRTRGWINATDTLDLPYRLPLPGVNVELTQYLSEEGRLSAELDRIAAAGFTWVRQPFLWANIQPNEDGLYEWDAYDAIVEAVDAHETLELVAVLDGTPAWARSTLAVGAFSPPASAEQYANFTRAVADHYANSITYYQIWDEPNIRSHWGFADPRPAHYVRMLCGAYESIHAVDSDSNVIAAALAPNIEAGPSNLSDLRFLQAFYDLDGQDCFDAAAAKPYGYNSGAYDRRVESDKLNFSRWILLREEMVRRGDGKKPLWGSNFGWNHLPDDWTGPSSIWGSVTAEEQERYTREAYERASREWPWAGGLILQHWDPDESMDEAMQGFALAPRIDAWLENGPLFSADALIPGLYPVVTEHADYTADWAFSPDGRQADPITPEEGIPPDDLGHRITVRFEGTSFALPVQRSDYLAYLYITIDGQQANALPRTRDGEAFLVLKAPEEGKPERKLIRVADGLSDNVHTAEIVHGPLSWAHWWPITGFAVASPPDTAHYDRALLVCWVIGGLGLLGAAVTATRLPWRRVKPPSMETVRLSIEWLLSLFASLVVLVGALLTWDGTLPSLLKRDPPALAITIVTAGIASLSPVFVVTLAALLVLFVLIYNRPLLGIMLIIFWSAFFLTTMDLFFRLFAVVEVYFALTLVALIGRGMVEWARQRQAVLPKTPRQPIRLQPMDWIVVAFVALSVLSLSWATFWTPATHQLRVIILEPAAFYALLRLMRLDRRDQLWLVDTLLFTGAAIAVVGLWGYFTGDNVVKAEDGTRRLISVYGSPNGVGLYLGRCLPFALVYTLLPVGDWRRNYGIASGALMLAAVMLSQSRGAILLGLPAAFVVVMVLWRGRRALVPLVAAGIGIILVLVPLSLVLPRLGDLTGETAFFRENLWYSSISLIKEHPVTGVGLDQFLYWYRSRYLLPEAWAEPDLSIPHNILLNYWVNLGILGVLVGFAFQAIFWRRLWQVYRRVLTADPVALALILGLAGSMADFLAHGLVDVGYFLINQAFVFFLSLALLQRLTYQTRALEPHIDQTGE